LPPSSWSSFYLDIVEIPALYFLGIWFLMQLSIGIASIGVDVAAGAVAFWAHVAGFAAGAVVGSALRLFGSDRRYWRNARSGPSACRPPESPGRRTP
jgi:membrane associated rhomboid family serine protease